MITESTLDNETATTICAIGASAGGLAPVEEFFDAMPTNTGAAFVVVQHLSPDHESMMVSLLSRKTPMPVEQAIDGSPIRRDHVYLIAPGTQLLIEEDRLRVEPRDPSSREVPKPINHFFTSMADAYGARSIAIVLSGTGSDGTIGIEAVHRAGGLVMAQDQSAAFEGMPNAASESGFVHAVMDPTSLAGAVVRFATTGQRPGSDDSSQALSEHETLILSYLAESSEIDFRDYKPGTTKRRLERRMSLTEHDDMAQYADFVRSSETERSELVEDLFIDVTEFFRDTEAFKIVEETVMPKLLADAVEQQRPFRIWVPGCATGEEAYSLTMLAVEAADRLDGPAPFIQTFATDLHTAALERASRGAYSPKRVSKLSPERLERFFQFVDGEYVVTKELRSMLTFARHNLLSDPPFTRVDLVSCRNLLIYFRTAAQERAIASMGFALRSGGVLFLGPSETLGIASPDYEPVDPTWRLWRKEFDYIERKYRRPQPPRAKIDITVPPVGAAADFGLNRAYDIVLQEQFAGGLLVSNSREIVYVLGNAKNWLEYPSGRPTSDVLTLIKDTNLRLAVAAALRELETGAKASQPRPVIASDAPTDAPVALIGKRVESGHQQLHFLIYTVPGVLPVSVPEPFATVDSQAPTNDAHVAALETELRHTRSSLQSLLEEQEISNEELNATNEELIASNEELQSTNEELSSVNEELRTLNDEHQHRIDQVLELSADLEQLMSAADIAVIFLAEDKTVRRFNEPARRYFKVRDNDVGRPFSDLSSTLVYDDLEADVEATFRSGEIVSRAVRNSQHPGQRLVAQVCSYELPRQRSGVLIAIVDVTEVQLAEEERMLATTLKDLPAYFAIWNQDHQYIYVNRVLGQPQLDDRQVLYRSLDEIYGSSIGNDMATENEEILQSQKPLHTMTKVNGEEVIVSKFVTHYDGKPHVAGIAFALDDFTGVPEMERALLTAEAFDDSQTLVVIDPHGRTIRANGVLDHSLPMNWLDPDGISAVGLDPGLIRPAFRRASGGEEAAVVDELWVGPAKRSHAFRFRPSSVGQLAHRYPVGSVVLRVVAATLFEEELKSQRQRIAELQAEVDRLQSDRSSTPDTPS